MHTLLTEYDEEAVMEGFRQRAYEEGEEMGLKKVRTNILFLKFARRCQKGNP